MKIEQEGTEIRASKRRYVIAVGVSPRDMLSIQPKPPTGATQSGPRYRSIRGSGFTISSSSGGLRRRLRRAGPSDLSSISSCARTDCPHSSPMPGFRSGLFYLHNEGYKVISVSMTEPRLVSHSNRSPAAANVGPSAAHHHAGMPSCTSISKIRPPCAIASSPIQRIRPR